MKPGKILVFVNLGYSKLDGDLMRLNLINGGSTSNETNAWSVDQSSGKVNVNFFGDINLQGNSLINVQKILGMDGKWSLDENGKFVVKEIETEKPKVQNQAEFGSKEKPIGATLYDEETGEPYCLKISDGQVLALAGVCGAASLNMESLSTEAATSTETATSTSP